MPKISVIVPAYKSEKTIKNCISSVIKQTFRDMEIIVVLKESGDKTEEYIKQFNDERIHIIKQTDDTGAGGARNLGIKHAKGEWIGFVETDDTISPDFYQKLMSAITEEDIEIIIGEIKIHDDYMTYNSSNQTFTNISDKYHLIKNGATFDKIFKKSLISTYDIKCSEKIRYEDNIFIFKSCYYAKKIKTVHNALYFYDPKPWSPDYIKVLQKSIPIEAQEIVQFIKQNKFSAYEKKLAYKKIIKSFVGDFLWTSNIYKVLIKMLDHPFFLMKMYWTKRIKDKFNKIKRKFSKGRK